MPDERFMRHNYGASGYVKPVDLNEQPAVPINATWYWILWHPENPKPEVVYYLDGKWWPCGGKPSSAPWKILEVVKPPSSEWPCNDCGTMIPKYDELCSKCHKEERELREAQKAERP